MMVRPACLGPTAITCPNVCHASTVDRPLASLLFVDSKHKTAWGDLSQFDKAHGQFSMHPASPGDP